VRLRSLTYHRSSTVLFFIHTPTTVFYTLSLHDALPIYRLAGWQPDDLARSPGIAGVRPAGVSPAVGGMRFHLCALVADCQCATRSEEHTSELQSRENLVCRLLLEKKNVLLPKPTNHVFT